MHNHSLASLSCSFTASVVCCSSFRAPNSSSVCYPVSPACCTASPVHFYSLSRSLISVSCSLFSLFCLMLKASLICSLHRYNLKPLILSCLFYNFSCLLDRLFCRCTASSCTLYSIHQLTVQCTTSPACCTASPAHCVAFLAPCITEPAPCPAFFCSIQYNFFCSTAVQDPQLTVQALQLAVWPNLIPVQLILLNVEPLLLNVQVLLLACFGKNPLKYTTSYILH